MTRVDYPCSASPACGVEPDPGGELVGGLPCPFDPFDPFGTCDVGGAAWAGGWGGGTVGERGWLVDAAESAGCWSWRGSSSRRYSERRSMPRMRAACVLLPPTAFSTWRT